MQLLDRILTATTRPGARGRRSAGCAGCAGCAAGLAHCHDVLVLHADGTAECAGHPACDLHEAGHDHVVACTELERCGCTGDDHDLDAWFPAAD
jgi:hypothetical protein